MLDGRWPVLTRLRNYCHRCDFLLILSQRSSVTSQDWVACSPYDWGTPVRAVTIHAASAISHARLAVVLPVRGRARIKLEGSSVPQTGRPPARDVYSLLVRNPVSLYWFGKYVKVG